MSDHYDLCVIGGGAAGLVAAGGAAQLGARTLLIERDRLGGECLYTGCVPSKALLAAAARARLGSGGWAEARASVRDAIATIEPHDSPERFRGFGVEVVKARAEFIDRHRLSVDGRTVTARRFVIASGSDPAIPPVPGLSEVPYLTNETIFELAEQPSRLLIVGGGPIGCELAQAFARLGTRVIVVQRGKLLPKDDPAAADVVRSALIGDGVALHEDVNIVAARRDAAGLTLELEVGARLSGTHLLVAAGRAARTHGLGLAAAGVDFDQHGIRVDHYLRTSNRRVFAIGDCRAGPRLTHAADQDARCVIQNALFPLGKRADYTALPACTYTDPELAQVGLTEPAARRLHPRLAVWRHDFDHNDRSVTERDGRGFVKLMALGNRVVGATIVGAHAGELLALASFAVAGKLSLSDLAARTFAYPTLAEALRFAAEQPGQARLFSPAMRRLTGLFQRLP